MSSSQQKQFSFGARFVPKTTPPMRLLSFVDDLLAGRAPRYLEHAPLATPADLITREDAPGDGMGH